MNKLVFATNNKNKLKEVRSAFPQLEILSLQDINCREELPETQSTIKGNALQKAAYVNVRYGYPCFADDTGLLVDALDGEPGVYSARYAGEQCSAEDNMDKLLSELQGKPNRNAQFVTVIAFVSEEHNETFEGMVEGVILEERQGKDGFGYDPIFQPENESRSFAEMSQEEKNAISHRGRAVRKFVEWMEGSLGM